MGLTPDQTTTALQLLADKAAERGAEIEKYNQTELHGSTDEECDSQSPVFDSFYNNGGNESLRSMTNFTSIEFEKIYGFLVEYLNSNWNVGRGRRCQYGAKDVFFMTLSVLKHAGQWDYMAKMFNMKGPTFEKIIMGFVKLVSGHAYELFVDHLTEKYTIEVLNAKGKNFKYYPFSLYATDATFQQSNRPSGNIQEAKVCYSGKHKLYGYKVEMSIRPNGYARHCSRHVPGSISDLELFYRNLDCHKTALTKTEDEKEISDDALHSEVYPDMWAVIVDKGYQGLLESVRAVSPKKTPRNGSLTVQERNENKNISSDRIISENYFGRLCSLWEICGSKFRWKESYYDYFVCLSVALTNMHIKWNPLRAEDGDFYRILQSTSLFYWKRTGGEKK